MSNRHKAREFALEVIYAWDISGEEPDQVFEKLLKKQTPLKPAKKTKRAAPQTVKHRLDEASAEFAQALVSRVVRYQQEIDTLIQERSENWDLSRVALLDKHILRIAIAEIYYMEDIPVKVSIDEAIELGKKYSTENSSKFINGILDSIAFKKKETS